MATNEPRRQKNNSVVSGTGERGKYTRSRRAFTWGSIERSEIGQLVCDVCDSGHGLVLGRTADGGALSITVLDGDERIREWPASVEDFTKFAVWCNANMADVPFDASTN